ncbi:STAS domain-containing protein [Thermoanaerobacter wiegelii]|uniref:Anti-sigma-factor antagonist n=1 Tax=Thermoanaerobacter wiegelii Rt8.B1 TaxID=697303 RepID=G2MXY7_9THEO|nr:STAS domain-containing protein [Thermoanaerobacter wiegelii]AEM79735.1 anti-sigma-factor antagonist [Thermoanaerobacter wiegelii Rt8.B1]
MKETIIYNLKTLVEEITESDNTKKEWEDFLVSLADALGSEDMKGRIKEPLKNLLNFIDVGALVKGMELLNARIEGFPLAEMLKVVIEVLDEIKNDKEMRIKELGNILAELATPIIRIWRDVLLVPLIGTLDSHRAQSMAEKLLERTASTRAKIVIVDVTGVPMIDTIVGGFLIEMFNAIKLLGSDVILTGIKPEIAHTLVKLGVDFNMVIIKRDLESALKHAIDMTSDNREERHGQKRGSNYEE